MENFKAKISQLRAFFLLMKLNFETFFSDHIYWIACALCVGVNYLLIFSHDFLIFNQNVYGLYLILGSPGNLILVTFSMIFTSQIIKDY
jgi:hypothetical protein